MKPLAVPIALFLAFVAASRPAYSQQIAPPTDSKLMFENSVLPIFQNKCLQCHGQTKQKAGLDLRTRGAILEGGDSGPGFKPGAHPESILWEKIHDDRMPPGKEKLTALEKETIKRWIGAGGPSRPQSVAATPASADVPISEEDRQFWSFQKPTRPAVPVSKRGNDSGNPIDAFIRAQLERKALVLSPEADRLTLLRRVTFDLTGLPPAPHEINSFLADASPNAYEKVVTRLLASPSYGERWGRHWLDLAGYADSEGILDADYVRTAAWRYRDYVIRAFNKDKPYDRFLQEQIAGDELTDYWSAYQTQKELPANVVEAVIATGYLRCASDTSRPDFANINNAPGYYFQTLDDTLKIVASSTMGLTVQCAKCHSHKYDPIPQTEYYRLQAIFMSGYRPGQWVPQVQRRLLEATAIQEQAAREHNAKADALINGFKKQQQALQEAHTSRLFEQNLAKLPGAIREDVRAALARDAAKRTEVQKYLADKFQAELRPAGPILTKKLEEDPEYRRKQLELTGAIKKEEGRKVTFPEIRAFYDVPGEAKTQLLRRGEYLQPGKEVAPGVLSVLGVMAGGKAFQVPTRPKDARTSGRRLAFARWLTCADHPLTARVFVNRLWLHHFGQGLVATPDNFGKTGSPPSHPELLDWLACEFMAPCQVGEEAPQTEAGPWSVKHLQRIIVTSAAYKQASAYQPALHAKAKQVDPDNRLLWRQRLRRLEAEALRDAVLAVSGSLNPQKYGPPVPMVRSGTGEVSTPSDATGNRRSIYLQVRRSQPLTFLQLFDQPVIETNCTLRETSTVASQALTLLNSDWMQRQASALAERACKEEPADPAGRAVLLAFGRPATKAEKTLFQQFLERQAQNYARTRAQVEAARSAVGDLCHMLLSANEFAYID